LKPRASLEAESRKLEALSLINILALKLKRLSFKPGDKSLKPEA
jgi:hypothetical protein